MTNKKEITAGIIIIGNEVLSGRTKDINTSTLAKWLNSIGDKYGYSLHGFIFLYCIEIAAFPLLLY